MKNKINYCLPEVVKNDFNMKCRHSKGKDITKKDKANFNTRIITLKNQFMFNMNRRIPSAQHHMRSPNSTAQ